MSGEAFVSPGLSWKGQSVLLQRNRGATAVAVETRIQGCHSMSMETAILGSVAALYNN